MSGTEIAVRMQGVGKSFGDPRILDDITIDSLAGSVHALVDENGAGKSSVGKIVGGHYSADESSVEIFGARVTRFSPHEAPHRGVARIHQELHVVPELTVPQNVFPGQTSDRAGVLTRGDLARFRQLDKT